MIKSPISLHPNPNQLFSQRYMVIKKNSSKSISILLNWIIYNVPKDVKKWPKGSKYSMIFVNHMTVSLQMKEKIICSNISVCFPDEIIAQINTMKKLMKILKLKPNKNHHSIKKLLLACERARSQLSKDIFSFKIG